MKIIVADDQQAAFDIALKACNALGIYSLWVGEQEPIDSEVDFRKWVKASSKVEDDLLVILDLGLRGTGQRVWDTVNRLISADDRTLVENEQLPDTVFDGIALALASGKERGQKRTFYYIASTQARLGIVKHVIEQLFMNRGWAQCAVRVGMSSSALADYRRNDAGAQRLVSEALEMSGQVFPTILPEGSRDPIIESLLAELQCVTQLRDFNATTHTDWHHDRLHSKDYRGVKFLTETFCFTAGETRNAKALMQCGAAGLQSMGLGDILTTASVWTTPAKVLSQANCKRVLARLEVGDVVFTGSDDVWPPIMPALPFLFALRCFIRQLDQDGAPSTGVTWDCGVKCGRIEVGLASKRQVDAKEEETPPFGLRDKYLKKIAEGQIWGVSGALHDLVYGRLSNLRGGGAIALLFQGHGRSTPLVQLRWDPWKVAISWQI